MIQEFYDPRNEVDQLKTKLKEIIKAVKHLETQGKVQGSRVPPHVKEEVAKVYDEHGGINLLSKLTKIGFNSIHQWHKAWVKDPLVFRNKTRTASQRGSKVSSVVNSLVEPSSFETNAKSIKQLMQQKILEGKGLDQEVKNRVKEFCSEVGQVQEVSRIIGISERIIDKWVKDS